MSCGGVVLYTYKLPDNPSPIRERQILAMIDKGMKSGEIAAQLHISIHTVSCHRQEIIGKLQVKNTHEACRIAKSMGLLE